MSLTVTSTLGTVYHLWQLPALSMPELADEKEHAIISNPLTDGYRFNVLCGFTAGLRRWKVTFPGLVSSDITSGMTVTDINGSTVSREQYIRSLFVENKVTSTPFVYNWPQNSTNYWVDFEEPMMSMQRMRVKIYSTGLTMVQRRIAGDSLP